MKLTYDFANATQDTLNGSILIPIKTDKYKYGYWHYEIKNLIKTINDEMPKKEIFIISYQDSKNHNKNTLALYCKPEQINQEFLDDQKIRFLEIIKNIEAKELEKANKEAEIDGIIKGLKKYKP